MENGELARVFHAFSDENRLAILDLLSGGELCACRLLERLRIGQPTLSHHMKILCEAGVVRGRKDGRWIFYSIDPDGARQARGGLERFLVPAAPGSVPGCPESEE